MPNELFTATAVPAELAFQALVEAMLAHPGDPDVLIVCVDKGSGEAIVNAFAAFLAKSTER